MASKGDHKAGTSESLSHSSLPGVEEAAPTPAQPFKGRKHFPDNDERFLINYIRAATKKNAWYYRDRCGVARGPAPLPTLKEAWVHGLIDENTLVWGQGLADFIPIKNVRTLVPQIRSPEVRAATWLKKHLALKPALERARKERADERKWQSPQVDRMR